MLQGHHHSNGSAAAAAAATNGGVKVDDSATAATAAPSLRRVCLELQDKVETFLAEDVDTKILKSVQAQVKEAVGVIDEALDRYSIEELSLSYNGGKDCLVLLVLILACLPRHFEPTPASAATVSTSFHNGTTVHAHSQPPPNTPLASTPRATTPSPFPESLQSVYIVSPHPFAEVDEFVESSTVKFHLDLCRYALPMREALEAYLKDKPRLKAVFVGTRRTDPHGAQLTHFDKTDEGWPAFVRVHPVIDWHYTEIWAFIRHLQIPYISLYDQGYTSLGGTQDTYPNPKLKKGDDAEGFRPAYELIEDDEERLGRD
ncbi:3'-phosphoadenosine 5'-phosphosulfate sulfotransferase [Gnomoniopsis sp. IMI 355080]|nr:3'-phosphoadenosine 5'-phosphosulfate sulfotransferase [Gnomoniopsis sp. IMI 355080]